MENNSYLLDPLSEMLAVSSHANTKNVLITAVVVDGRLDTQAMSLAFRDAAREFPQLGSCLREIRNGSRYHLHWQPRPGPELPAWVHDLRNRDRSISGLDLFTEELRPCLDRDWDLFTEFPAELHIGRMTDTSYVVAPVVHHSAADAGASSALGKATVLRYFELTVGPRPAVPCYAHGVSTSVKREARPLKRSWNDLLYAAKQGLIPIAARPVLPLGTGRGDDLGQYHVKRVLTLDETERLVGPGARKRVPIVDLLAACSNLAIDIWNGDRNVPPGTVTTSVSINMKGRFKEFDAPNNSGLLYFKTVPEQRKDLRSLARSMSLMRIKQFRKQLDFSFYENVVRMNGALRPLPFRVRKHVVHRIMQRHQFSVAITFLGIVWPAARNGRPTGDSCMQDTDELKVIEVHGTGYKLLSRTHVLIISYIYDNRLNLVLAASACHFTREEARSFLDLVTHVLLSSAD